MAVSIGIEGLHLTGFGRFRTELAWQRFGRLNVLVGENDTGKTQLLKLLYAVTRTAEVYWRKQAGPTPDPFQSLLTQKLLWTFLPGGADFALGRLVSRGRSDPCRITISWPEGGLQIAWGARAVSHLSEFTGSGFEFLRDHSAIFLGAKEILSLSDAIYATRIQEELAAFDDTYLDLYHDFRAPIPPGRLQEAVYEVLDHLTETVGGGEVELDRDGRVWWVRKGTRFPMSQTAEGIRKVGVLFRLLRNRRINPKQGGFLFVDEPEANLHPRAEVLIATLLHLLARSGIQVFVATHSYFVLKRLEQLAREDRSDHELLDLRVDADGDVVPRTQLLREGLPADNPIIAAALDLFERDVELDWDDLPSV